MQQTENYSVSNAAINRVIIAIVLLIVLIEFGFYKTYIQHFPQFRPYPIDAQTTMHFNWIMHVHGILMMSWIMMLLVQPILILKGKIQWHKKLGKLSYVLAPLVVVALYLANRDGYMQTVAANQKQLAIALLSLTFPGIIFFSVLYGLAIYYRRNSALHMRFMCSTAVLFINPALDRGLITYFGWAGFDEGSTMVIVLVAIIMLVDSIRTKRLSAFALIFLFVLLHRLGWEIKETPYWQPIGNLIAKLF